MAHEEDNKKFIGMTLERPLITSQEQKNADCQTMTR